MATEFEGYAIVELMGHRKLAGHVREVTIAGGAFIRLDVPSDPPVTQYYGPSAVYCITPTTEELAKRVAQASRPTPVHQYELPAPRAASAAAEEDYDDGYDVDGERDYDPDEDRSPDSNHPADGDAP